VRRSFPACGRFHEFPPGVGFSKSYTARPCASGYPICSGARDSRFHRCATTELACMESKAWKVKESSAAAMDNVQGRFFRQVLDDFCSRGDGVIYRLCVDRQVVGKPASMGA